MSDVRAGRAYVELYAKDQAFRAGLIRAAAGLRRLGALSMGVARQMQVQFAAVGAAVTRVGTLAQTAGAKMSQAGRMMMGVGVAGLAPAVLAGKTFMEFDDQMRRVAAKTSETGAGLDELTNKARQLGESMSFTAAQVAGGMEALAQLGLSKDQILAATESVMNLARVTGVEVPQAAEVAASSMRAFGIEADDMTRVVDVLASATVTSGADFESLASTMTFVAATANVAGADIETVAGATAALADQGVKGTKAGTALRNMFLEMAAAGDRFNAIGIETQDAAGNVKPFLDVMDDLKGSFKDMGTAEVLATLNTLFGKRATTAAAILGFSDAGKSARNYTDALREAGGEADRVAQAMDAGLGGTWRRLLSVFESAMIDLGATLEPVFKAWAASLDALIREVKEFIAANPGFIQGLAEALPKLIAWGAGLMAGGSALTTLGSVLSAAGTAIAAVGSIIGALAGTFAALATPMGAIAAIGSSLVVLFGVHLYEAMGGVTGAVEETEERFGGLFDTFSDVWGELVHLLKKGEFQEALELALLAGEVVWLDFTDRIKQAWTDLWDWVADEFKSFSSKLLAFAKDLGAMITVEVLSTIPGIESEGLGIADQWERRFGATEGDAGEFVYGVGPDGRLVKQRIGGDEGPVDARSESQRARDALNDRIAILAEQRQADEAAEQAAKEQMERVRKLREAVALFRRLMFGGGDGGPRRGRGAIPGLMTEESLEMAAPEVEIPEFEAVRFEAPIQPEQVARSVVRGGFGTAALGRMGLADVDTQTRDAQKAAIASAEYLREIAENTALGAVWS